MIRDVTDNFWLQGDEDGGVRLMCRLCYVRTPDLELRDGDETLIVLTGGDLE